jgi:hypothetical protein
MHALSTAQLGRGTALITAVLLWQVPTLPAQVPSRIPSDPEAQIFNLIQRVTALEEKLAALTSGSASLRIKAPFEVVDAAGHPILQVAQYAEGAAFKPSGMVIFSDPKSGGGGLFAHNKAGSPVLALGHAGEGGTLALRDDAGKTRARMTGTGRLVILDAEENDLLTIAEDISKEEANIRIGGDDDGYAVEVGSGKGAAVLGTDADGVAELSLTDAQDRTRALMDAEGTLQISDQSGRDILSVAEDVTGENAGVAIGGGKGGGVVRLTDGGGKPAAGILGGKRAMVVVNSAGKTVAEMVANDGGDGLFQIWGGGAIPIALLGRAVGAEGGVLQISNGKVTVTSLLASEGGNGRWQLNDAAGTPIVEAGSLGSGRGTVRVGPGFKCVPITMSLRVPDCIVGRIE